MDREMNIEETLRKQIQAQQQEIDRLNKEVLTLRILAGPVHEDDVWIIEKRKSHEFKA